jgi:post-segregation antitoxin (ccd killing protein)
MWSRLLSIINNVQTIQIVIDSDLLEAADRAAKRLELNRSALFREAIRRYLSALKTEIMERRDREGYERYPDTEPDLAAWGGVAEWPEPE